MREPQTQAQWPFYIIYDVLIRGPFGAVAGAIIMLTGNAVLRTAGLAGYGSDAFVCVVGVIGGAISYTFLASLNISHTREITYTIRGVEKTRRIRTARDWLFDIVRWMVFTIVAATVGGAILWAARNNIKIKGPLDVKHALTAGVVGAAIFLPLVLPLLWRVTEMIDKIKIPFEF